MVTAGLDEAIDHFVEETMCLGVDANYPALGPKKIVKRIVTEDLEKQAAEMRNLIKAEAVNLADRIIGKERILHSNVDIQEGDEVLNPADKAVYDFQLEQRIILAEYQKTGKVSDTGIQFMTEDRGPDDLINNERSENEE